MNKELTLTQQQAAALRGITTRRLRQLENESDDPPPRNEKGKYPTVEFGEWLKTTYTGAQYDYERERARLTHHQANKTALEEHALKGDLIPADEVSACWGDMVTKFRAKMLALPGRLSIKAMSATSLREVEDFARDEIYRALDELSDTIVADNKLANDREED